MELKEMIKVMQHYEDGGEIEFSDDNFGTVTGKANKEWAGDLTWNWDKLTYRIKKEKKVTIEKWLCQDKQGDYLIRETSNIGGYLTIKKIKLIESYEVEL